jgi:hypothetical protein
MKTRTFCLMFALVALGCSTKASSALVITKVVAPTSKVTPGPPAVTTCVLDPAAPELSYLAFNPAENLAQVGAVVSNQMSPNPTANPLLQDATGFGPHRAIIDYEVLSGANNVGRQVSPVGGLEVSGGKTGTMAIVMFPKPSDLAGVGDGVFIRTYFHIEGKLGDGSNAHTGEHEYLFRVCRTPGCAQNVCL